MTKKEVLREIMNLIDDLDADDTQGADSPAGTPTRQPSRTELDSLATDIYMLCEAAIEA